MLNEANRQKICAEMNEHIAGAYECIADLQEQIKGYREDIAEIEEWRNTIERIILINSN